MPKIKPFDLDLGNGRRVRIDSYEEIDLDRDEHGFVGDDGTRLTEADMAATDEQLAARSAAIRRRRHE